MFNISDQSGDYCPNCGLEYHQGSHLLTLSDTGENPKESLENLENSLEKIIKTIEEYTKKETFDDVEKGLETSAEKYGVKFQLFSTSLDYSTQNLLAAYYLALKDITGVPLGEILMVESDKKPDRLEKIGFNVLNPRNNVKELFKGIFKSHDGTLGEYFKPVNKFCIINVPKEFLKDFKQEKMPREVSAFYNSLENDSSSELNKAILSHEMTHAFLFNEGKKQGFDIREAPNHLVLEEGAAWAVTRIWTDNLNPMQSEYPDELPRVIQLFINYSNQKAEGKKKIDLIREKAYKLIEMDYRENGLAFKEIEKALNDL